MALVLEILAVIALTFVLWTMISLQRHYHLAAAMDIPIVRMPVDPMSGLWMAFQQPIWYLLNLLPMDYGTFAEFSRRGWYFGDKARAHLRYGPIWALVTHRSIMIHVCDPGTVGQIFARPKDFFRNIEFLKILDVYGPTISSADPSNWPRHRKIMAPAFSESTMPRVWSETVSQAQKMTSTWVADSSRIDSIPKDISTLSINVLSAVVFHQKYAFVSSREKQVDHGIMNYRDALRIILDNVILILLVPVRFLSFPLLPEAVFRVGRAGAAFKGHAQQMMREEIALHDQGKGSSTLMGSMVRALYQNQKSQDTSSPRRGLTEDEIIGNTFIANFAGYDTTANTLNFMLPLLAANPDVQSWVAEELAHHCPESESLLDNYADLFPKLKRCRAVLLETLRLYPPVPSIIKQTLATAQTITVQNRTITIPANTIVHLNALALQTHPDHWDNPLEWSPKRWITSNSTTADHPSSIPLKNSDLKEQSTTDLVYTPGSSSPQDEELVSPTPNTYFPFSDGAQNCLGSKFVQVEVVVVMACIFRDHRLQVVPDYSGESAEQIKQRVHANLQDVDTQLIVRIRDPEKVVLRCCRHEG